MLGQRTLFVATLIDTVGQSDSQTVKRADIFHTLNLNFASLPLNCTALAAQRNLDSPHCESKLRLRNSQFHYTQRATWTNNTHTHSSQSLLTPIGFSLAASRRLSLAHPPEVRDIRVSRVATHSSSRLLPVGATLSTSGSRERLPVDRDFWSMRLARAQFFFALIALEILYLYLYLCVCVCVWRCLVSTKVLL